jgi:hypothetical protein
LRGWYGACLGRWTRCLRTATRSCCACTPFLLPPPLGAMADRPLSSSPAYGTDRLPRSYVPARAVLCRGKGSFSKAGLGQRPGLTRIDPHCPGVFFMFFFSGVSHPAGVLAHGHYLGRGVETTRIFPRLPVSSLGNLFFMLPHVSLRTATIRTAPAARNPELRGTPRAGLFAGLVEGISKGAGIMGTSGRLVGSDGSVWATTVTTGEF